MKTLAVRNFLFTSILYVYTFFFRRLIYLLLIISIVHFIRYQSFSFSSHLMVEMSLFSQINPKQYYSISAQSNSESYANV